LKSILLTARQLVLSAMLLVLTIPVTLVVASTDVVADPTVQVSPTELSPALSNDTSIRNYVTSMQRAEGDIKSGERLTIESKVAGVIGKEHYRLQERYNDVPIYGRWPTKFINS
jgi:hypothetical protein